MFDETPGGREFAEIFLLIPRQFGYSNSLEAWEPGTALSFIHARKSKLS
jgi:hypothetical protein